MSRIIDDVKSFVVVEFINRGRKRKTKCVEIVPKNWLCVEKCNKIETLKCFYPDPPYDEVDNMIKALVDPEKQLWKTYTVKCLYNTEDYTVAASMCEQLEEKSDLSSSCFNSKDGIGLKGDDLEDAIRKEELKKIEQTVDHMLQVKKHHRMNKDTKSIQQVSLVVEKTNKQVGVLQKDTTNHMTTSKNSDTWNENVETTERRSSGLEELEDDSETFQRQNHEQQTMNVLDKDSSLETSDGEVGTSDILNVTQLNPVAPEVHYEIPSRSDINNITKELNLLKKENAAMNKSLADLKKQNFTITNMLKEVIAISINNKRTESNTTDCENLTEKYSIAFPITSRKSLDTFEKNLKTKSQIRIDTKAVMSNMINGSEDLRRGARTIARKFLSPELASKFVVQRKTTCKNENSKEKEILKTTHPTLVNCIINTLMKQYKASEEISLRHLGAVITRSTEWGGNKKEEEKELENSSQDDID